MSGLLLFIVGFMLPLAVVGGIETVFYVMDLIQYRKKVRLLKFNKKLEDLKSAQENSKKVINEMQQTLQAEQKEIEKEQ